jgi:zinc transporter ZupT
MKWLIVGIIFSTSIVGVALPRFAKSRDFTLGNLFSGGILIAAALCHLLDDAQDGISDAIDDGVLPDFPWAMLLFGLGYIFMLVSLIESCPYKLVMILCLLKMKSLENVVLRYVESTLEDSPSTIASLDFGSNAFAEPLVDDSKIDLMTAQDANRSERPGSGFPFDRQRSSSSCVSVAHADENLAVLDMIEKDLTAGFAAFMALTFHSVIEGLSIGTQDDTSTTVSIAIAIICHKGFAAFALGCTLQKVKKAWIYWALCGIFCVASPIGTGRI